MKNQFFFISFCISLFWATAVFANEPVPLRVSDKADYSRIVFGWKGAVEYTLRREDGVLSVMFNAPAILKEDVKSVRNVGTYKITSMDPLTVRFTVPKSSKVRDFKIGKRVVIDVYDPENPEDKLAKPLADQVTPTPEAMPKKEQVTNSKKVIEDTPPAVKPAFVLVPEKLLPSKAEKTEVDTQKDKAQKTALKKAVNQENHMISLNATRGFGMNVFLHYGALWIVMDDDAALVKPNLTSPTLEIFGDFESVFIPNANAYKMTLPKDHNFLIKARGGGLVWEIILGNKVKPTVAPEARVTGDGSVVFPLFGASKILRTRHPETGQDLIFVTTEDARHYGSYQQSYVEFDVLRSPVGLAISPKVDDLDVRITDQEVQVSRPQGLALASPSDRNAAHIFKTQKHNDGAHDAKGHHAASNKDTNLYKFNDWVLGSAEVITKNENTLLAAFMDKSESKRVEDLITLGKMMLSHGLAAEALGYFDFAVSELPALRKSAEFKALRGAAHALDWKSENALRDLLHKSLKDEDEVKYWISFALSDLGDWQQAAAILPNNYKAIYDYPSYIAHPLALALAEVNLRAGKVKDAKELLTLVESDDGKLSAPHKAALKYLKGEAYRQKGKPEETKKIWRALAEGNDDFYTVKAQLALTILEANAKKIDTDEIIDRLEGLRYAWRGDDLEAQVKYWLGKAYFDKQEFIIGLSIMRDAAAIAGQTALAQRITTDMGQTYTDLYLGEDLKNVPALEAVAVYEQFRELTPIGDTGNKLEQNLAEHLVRAELLQHGAKLLRHQVNHRLQGQEKLDVAIRLAAIELMDKNPQRAVDALGKATETMRKLKDLPNKVEKQREIEFLRIRAYAQNKEYDKALELLEKLPPNQNVNRFKADVAWKARYWGDAAKFLNAVIIDENITPSTTLSQEQADMILSRAIALSLNDEQIALANMREKYTDLMQSTNKAKQFEVITRPRRAAAALADREALLSTVAEVDLFKDFLKSYRGE